VIDAAQRDRLIATAKETYFADRTFGRVMLRAAEAGESPETLERLGAFIRTGYVDVKRQDALELLRVIAREQANPTEHGDRPRFEFARTTHFDTLYNRAREVRRHGVPVALEDIANHFALEDEAFDDVNFHALNRALVLVFADYLGIDVTDDDVVEEQERFRRRLGLEDDTALERWLADNDVELPELTELLGGVALCRRLHRWFMVANWMQRSTRIVLDELRLDGRYPEWADRAAAEERVLRSRPELDARQPVRLSLDELAASHQQWAGRRFPTATRLWAAEAGFHTADNLRAALKRSRTARLAVLELLAASVPPADA
jgi:hypothetical protein